MRHAQVLVAKSKIAKKSVVTLWYPLFSMVFPFALFKIICLWMLLCYALKFSTHIIVFHFPAGAFAFYVLKFVLWLKHKRAGDLKRNDNEYHPPPFMDCTYKPMKKLCSAALFVESFTPQEQKCNWPPWSEWLVERNPCAQFPALLINQRTRTSTWDGGVTLLGGTTMPQFAFSMVLVSVFFNDLAVASTRHDRIG